MIRFVRFLIRFTYYHSLLFGVHAFYYNFQNGAIRTTRFLKYFSLLMTLLIVISMLLIIQALHLKTLFLEHQQRLHEMVYTLIRLVQISCVIITLLTNWLKRLEFIKVLRALQFFHHYFLQRFVIESAMLHTLDTSIILRFIRFLVLDITIWMISIDACRFHGLPATTAMLLITNILSLVMNQYFFGVQRINIYFHVLNREIERVLDCVHASSKSQPVDLLNAAALDELALFHHRLVELAKRFGDLFVLQNGCMVFVNYLAHVGFIYMLYVYVRFQTLAIATSSFGGGLLLGVIVLTCWDLRVLLGSIFGMQHIAELGATLLRQHLLCGRLDAPMEHSIERFVLQIARNPLDYDLLGLFHFNTQNMFTIYVSAFYNAIVVMQYDYENFNLD